MRTDLRTAHIAERPSNRMNRDTQPQVLQVSVLRKHTLDELPPGKAHRFHGGNDRSDTARVRINDVETAFFAAGIGVFQVNE